MKKIIIFIASITIMVTNMFAGSISVPTSVEQSFMAHYPHAENVCWEKVGNEYRADFYLHQHEAKVLFDANGNIDEVDVLVNWKDLPKDVKMFVYKNFHAFAIQECDVVEHNGHEDGYTVIMISGNQTYTLHFNHNHQFCKAECVMN